MNANCQADGAGAAVKDDAAIVVESLQKITIAF